MESTDPSPATEPDDDIHLVCRNVCPHLGHRAAEPARKRCGSTIGSPWKRHLVDDKKLVAPLRYQPRLQPLRGPEDAHIGTRAPSAQPISNGQQGVHMPGGPAAGQQVGRHRPTLSRPAE